MLKGVTSLPDESTGRPSRRKGAETPAFLHARSCAFDSATSCGSSLFFLVEPIPESARRTCAIAAGLTMKASSCTMRSQATSLATALKTCSALNELGAVAPASWKKVSSSCLPMGYSSLVRFDIARGGEESDDVGRETVFARYGGRCFSSCRRWWEFLNQPGRRVGGVGGWFLVSSAGP